MAIAKLFSISLNHFQLNFITKLLNLLSLIGGEIPVHEEVHEVIQEEVQTLRQFLACRKSELMEISNSAKLFAEKFSATV